MNVLFIRSKPSFAHKTRVPDNSSKMKFADGVTILFPEMMASITAPDLLIVQLSILSNWHVRTNNPLLPVSIIVIPIIKH